MDHGTVHLSTLVLENGMVCKSRDRDCSYWVTDLQRRLEVLMMTTSSGKRVRRVSTRRCQITFSKSFEGQHSVSVATDSPHHCTISYVFQAFQET
jgi:hypothetical protein